MLAPPPPLHPLYSYFVRRGETTPSLPAGERKNDEKRIHLNTKKQKIEEKWREKNISKKSKLKKKWKGKGKKDKTNNKRKETQEKKKNNGFLKLFG